MARLGPATGCRGGDSRTGVAGWQAHADGHAARYRVADVTDTGSSCDRRQRGCRPAARSSPARHATASRLAVGPTIFARRSSFSAALSSIDSANSFFSLRFSSSSIKQPFGLRHIHAAVFALTVVQGGFRDAVLARQLSGPDSNPPCRKNSAAGQGCRSYFARPLIKPRELQLREGLALCQEAELAFQIFLKRKRARSRLHAGM